VPPIVLLHGFAHTPASWDHVRPHLPWPTVDCPLSGHDRRWPVATTWDQTIDAMRTRLPTDAIAIGYSLGARVALALLARDAIAGAVLVSVHPGLRDPAERDQRRRADAAWIDQLRTGDVVTFLRAWEAQSIFASDARRDPAVIAARRSTRGALDPRRLADAMAVLGLAAMPDYRDALLARADRARLIVGSDDRKFRQIADELAAVAPALGPHLVDGSGHDPTLDAPAALAAQLTHAIATLTATVT
jgi:2-succinyl-6-hydroxy-2,4-cyclohexadiene-1-carboxylate synthase